MNLKLTDQQQAAIASENSVSVIAGAGTGKTALLVERYLHFLNRGYSPLQIVAMTFTNKAAAELRSRLRQALTQRYPDRWDWLGELEAAPIGTFHSVAGRICREQAEFLGIPADFQTLEEWEQAQWQRTQLTLALNSLPPETFQELSYGFGRSQLEQLLANPLDAREALAHTLDHWRSDFEQEQKKAFEALIQSAPLQALLTVVPTHGATDATDKLEVVRQRVLGYMEVWEHHHYGFNDATQNALMALKTLKVGTVGSAKNWGGKEQVKFVRGVIMEARDFIKEFPLLFFLENAIGDLDHYHETVIARLRDIFEQVDHCFHQRKKAERHLNFNDLEIYALRALENPAIQTHYHQRWRVFLIDEFQDTNHTQGKLLEILTAQSILTIVGDEKQSIYGFRGGDVAVFRRWVQKIGHSQALTQSFRTHHSLIQDLNHLFEPVLQEQHQGLVSDRPQPHRGPHLELWIVDPNHLPPDTSSIQKRRIEARFIAQKIATLIADGVEIWDRHQRCHRPIAPKDIAILSSTWKNLRTYGQALGNQNIPYVQAGGDDLLDTQEAKDGRALLQFLANPHHDLALVTLLRSPLFMVSDRLLWSLAPQLKEFSHWWPLIQNAQDPTLQGAVEILKKLRSDRLSPPSRLLQWCDRLTGYSAVIKNLPHGERRLRDWQGFGALVRHLEQGLETPLTVVRRLAAMEKAEAKINRPSLEGGNGVTLMSIHSAKGLEWPMVILPDLSRKQNHSPSPSLLFDPAIGVACKLPNGQGDWEKPLLYQWLHHRQKQREQEETKRLLYVALTRAGDRLLLTSPKAEGNSLNLLRPGLEPHFETQWIQEGETPADLPSLTLALPDLGPAPTEIFLQAIAPSHLTLPVTALTTYHHCPRRFQYQYLEGNPGLNLGPGQDGAAIGSLTHIALEKSLTQRAALQAFNPQLPPEKVQEALDLAQRFRTDPLYQPYGQGKKEQYIRLKQGGITFNGYVDLVGEDFVLDFKTDRHPRPQEHRFQLWAYAMATQKPQAHIAYLRSGTLHSFHQEDLAEITTEAQTLVQAMETQRFEPTPSPEICGHCPYQHICGASEGNGG